MLCCSYSHPGYRPNEPIWMIHMDFRHNKDQPSPTNINKRQPKWFVLYLFILLLSFLKPKNPQKPNFILQLHPPTFEFPSPTCPVAAPRPGPLCLEESQIPMAGEDYPSEPDGGSIPSDTGGASQEVPQEWRQQAGVQTLAAATVDGLSWGSS